MLSRIARRLLGSRALLGLAFLMLGGALATAFALLTIGLLTPLLDPVQDVPAAVSMVVGAVIGVLLVGLVGALPAVRRIEGVATESLLGVAFPGGTPRAAARWDDRFRSVAWLWAHLVAGATFVFGAAALPVFLGDLRWWLFPVGLVVSVVGGAALVAGLRLVALPLLGASVHERIAALERQTAELGARNRIAREIHDSVGHALSLVTVQAAAARRVQTRDPAFVADALAAIEDASRQAAAELDHVLGLLRADEAPRHTTPDLTALGDLVAATRRAGLDVTLDDKLGAEDVAELSPVASRELYRVAQEGLANVLRHGSGPCRIRLGRRSAEVELEITNEIGTPTTRSGRPRRRTGSGVAGIVDRVEAIGGRATVGPADGGRWQLRAVLPWVAR
ncbi:sensor histidine kinase [Nocardioides speluncae]|uniref:sensor histidine kinase n=1 Tax=Nocardioides speluncae TaxID=2670337 RepID=UPI000D691F80|nr:histidine kinase [Nocardioides speluncae]